MKLRQLLFAALFAALMCATKFIPPIQIIPNLPITFQTFVVFLAGLMLRPLYSFASMMTYTALGLIGLPVFTYGGGIGYPLAQPSFGFIIGFSICALLISLFVRKNLIMLTSKNQHNAKVCVIVKIIFFSLLSICVLYVIGIAYLYVWLEKNTENVMSIWTVIKTYTGFYLLIDIVKFGFAIPLGYAVLKRLPPKFKQI
ncbi:MAG: biotin transporter BioY [Clostridia bacterium]|jgi:biotin transport system substrate-specific component|nr:biotin transporter BioY [Clostridia bacterium]